MNSKNKPAEPPPPRWLYVDKQGCAGETTQKATKTCHAHSRISLPSTQSRSNYRIFSSAKAMLGQAVAVSFGDFGQLGGEPDHGSVCALGLHRKAVVLEPATWRSTEEHRS